jgi:epoxyqueuosine reductase
MLAMNYRSVEPKAVQAGEGCVSRYAWGIDYHEVIRPRLHRLADFHRRLVPNACVRGVVDTAPLLERGFAHQAGLGWIGKNTTLIHPTYGSWLFLAALLTSEELVFDVPMEGDPCSTCRACLDACPSGALQAPYRLDARRCISCLTIELRGEIPPDGRKALGNRVFGCDACQEACPWNQQGATAAEQAFYPQPGMNPVVLDELAAMDESEFRRRFGHSPLKRAGCAGIRRNIAAVSENQSRNHQ